ncbi:hypothetical protein C8F04DRAFT_1276675 [Mycena alexandri]|uniref:Uncharacterized protein n=1 Tax=Mycena alexandri TaxID=1745969 RepID=A0AAD6WS96_9AGAR|nr:hypothetical protein C8F04DRAFT_1276675 [Mycena alexandri]
MHLFFENIVRILVALWSGKFKGLDVGSEDYEIASAIWEEIWRETAEAVKHIPAQFVRSMADGPTKYNAEAWCFWFVYVAPIFTVTHDEIADLRVRINSWLKRYEEPSTIDSLPILYLNGHKTIQKQKVTRVDKVIELMIEKYPYFRHFEGGWPICDLMKKVLQNSVNALKVDDRAEALATTMQKCPEEVDEEGEGEEADKAGEDSASDCDSDDEMSDIEGERAFKDALGSDEDSDNELPVQKMGPKPAKKPSKKPDKENRSPLKRKNESQEDVGSNPPQKKAQTDGTPVARPQSKPHSSKPMVVSAPWGSSGPAAKPVLPTPPKVLSKCPKSDCPDLLPKTPLSADLAHLISHRNKILTNPRQPTHALDKIDQKICETISLKHKRRKLATIGRNLGWPLALDFPPLLTRIVALKDDLFELATDPDLLGESIAFLDFLNAVDGHINEFVEQGSGNFPEAIKHSRAGYPAPPTPKKHKKKVKLPSSPPEEVELTLDDFPQCPKKSRTGSKAKHNFKYKPKTAKNSTPPAKRTVPVKKAPPAKQKATRPSQPAAPHGYGTHSSKLIR